jgi:hypothetical protein
MPVSFSIVKVTILQKAQKMKTGGNFAAIRVPKLPVMPAFQGYLGPRLSPELRAFRL